MNELAAKNAPVWVSYDTGDRAEEGPFFASRRDDGGWDFDGGMGGIIVEKDGWYGPQGGQKYDPKAMFLSTYVYGVYEAVKKAR